MVRTQIQLTKGQAEALKEMAASQHVSVAEMIRRSIDALIRSSFESGDDERWRRAAAAVGRFRSDKSDVSTEHDRYLAEAYRT